MLCPLSMRKSRDVLTTRNSQLFFAQVLRCFRRNAAQIRNSALSNFGNEMRGSQQEHNTAHSRVMGTQSSTCAFVIDLIIIPVFRRKKREQRGLRIWFVPSHNYNSNWQSSFSKPCLIRASHHLSHHPRNQECLRSYDHMYKNCSSCWEARTGSFQNKPSDGRVVTTRDQGSTRTRILPEAPT